jgi:hypothetical protein
MTGLESHWMAVCGVCEKAHAELRHDVSLLQGSCGPAALLSQLQLLSCDVLRWPLPLLRCMVHDQTEPRSWAAAARRT